MSTDSLVSPQATARFVVTLPPEPSRLGDALGKDIAEAFTALTDRAMLSDTWPSEPRPDW